MHARRARIFSFILLFCAALGSFAGFYTARASAATPVKSNPLTELKKAGQSGGEATATADLPFPIIVMRGARLALSLVSMILVIIILYAGFLWWSAGGNEDQVSKAKTVLRNAFIGLLVIMLTRTIIAFVVESLVAAEDPSLQSVVEEKLKEK